MVLSQVNDYRYKHGECFLLISLQNVQEIIVFKEAHRSVRHLQVNTANTLHNSLEQFWYQMLYFVDFAYFQYFLELCQEKCFLDAIGEWPEFKESIEQLNRQCPVFGQEKH